MNYEFLIGMALLLLGFGIILLVAIAREQPLVYLSGLGVAAMGATLVVAGSMPPGPARIGVQIFFFLVVILAGLFQWRMARRLQGSRRGTLGQKSGGD